MTFQSSISTWLVNPFDDIPGEGMPPLRYWSLARELAARGHRVTWWSATWSHRKKSQRSESDAIGDCTGFSVRLIPVRQYRCNISITRVLSHRDFGLGLERLALAAVNSGTLTRPDILLASFPPFEGCEAAKRLAKALGATFILDVMDLWPETFARLLPRYGGFRKLVEPALFHGLTKRRDAVIGAANAITAPCRTYMDGATTRASEGTPRHICYQGCDVELLQSKVRVIGQTTDTLQCVYAGSLEASQDIEILPRVAKHLSDRRILAKIHVAGTGSQEHAIHDAAKQLNGSCSLIVHGLLGTDAYAHLLSNCHVGLVCVKPDSMVAMPYKAADYAAAGLAILNSLPGELSEMLERYQAGLPYTAENPFSMAEVIASLAVDQPRLAAMQNAARRMAENEFDRRKTYAAFAQWIEGIHRGTETVI